jgi:predicted permease
MAMPDWKPEIRRRLARLRLAPTREAAIVEELAQHLDDCYVEFMTSGANEVEAYQQTLGELRDSELLKRELRQLERQINLEPIVLGTNQRSNMIAGFWQDLRYGARMLAKQPAFTLIAVLSLSLGIGANTAIFSLIDAVLLKMLPVAQPEQLVFIQNVGPRRPEGGAPPYPCFERFRDRNQSLSGLAAFSGDNLRLKVDGQMEEVLGQRVSGNYFALLGINALLGRVFNSADDTVPGQGGPNGLVAVISYKYWTQRFGRQPAVIGKVVQLGNQPVTIIGVTPPDFYGLAPGIEFNFTIPLMSVGAERLSAKEGWWFQAVGRLKPDVPVEQARAELDTIFQAYMDETNMNAEARREVFNRIDLRSASKGLNSLRQQFSRPLQALMAIVALVLLIACANVANLLLARATARRKEFAVRLALGANRFRLLRQMLTESLLLVTLGGLVGLILARWGSAFLVNFIASGRERIVVKPALDWRLLAFTAGVALLTGLLFGLMPALQATRTEPNAALKNSTGVGRRARFGKPLVVAQVALSLLLLVGAGLLLRTLYNLRTVDAGFRPEGVLTMRVHAPETIAAGERRTNFWKETLARVERLPGVQSASLTTLSPLDGADRGVRIEVSGFNAGSDRDKEIRLNEVSPGYFQTFGIPVLQGRSFTAADSENAPKVALLNEAAAHFYFGNRNPLGAQVRFAQRDQFSPPYEIIGVIKDARYENLRAPDTRLIYLPVTPAIERSRQLTLAVRSAGKPAELTNAITHEARAIDANVFLTNITTLNERVDQSLVQERLVATLALFFGLLALLLACIGLYGVMSYDVARRTNEIGIRIALGADARRVMQLVLRETLLWVMLGLACGLVAAFATTRWLESLLFGLKPHDLLTIGLAALVLLAVALVAGYLPARRAARVDPLVALRHE